MKITDEVVQRFEEVQRATNTKTAIYNLLWMNAAEQLTDIGVLHVSTSLSHARRQLERAHRAPILGAR